MESIISVFIYVFAAIFYTVYTLKNMGLVYLIYYIIPIMLVIYGIGRCLRTRR